MLADKLALSSHRLIEEQEADQGNNLSPDAIRLSHKLNKAQMEKRNSKEPINVSAFEKFNLV
jgi:hypothetical protein